MMTPFRCACGVEHKIGIAVYYTWMCDCGRWYQRRGLIIVRITHPDDDGYYDTLEVCYGDIDIDELLTLEANNESL